MSDLYQRDRLHVIIDEQAKVAKGLIPSNARKQEGT